MIINKQDTSVAIITASFTSATGAGVAPGTSFKVQIYDSASTPAAKLTAGGESMAVLDSITGVYFYRWTVTSIAVGNYSAVFLGVDSAITYPNTVDITVVDSGAIEDKIDIIDTNVDTVITNTTGLAAKLPYLDQYVSKAGSGNGTIEVPIETNDDLGNALPNSSVYITSDIAGVTKVTNTQITNSDGITTFYMSAGTYYVWMFNAAKTWANPGTITVV